MESLQLNKMKDQEASADNDENRSLQELPKSTSSLGAPQQTLSPMQATVPSISPEFRSLPAQQQQQFSPQSHQQLLKRIFKIIVIGKTRLLFYKMAIWERESILKLTFSSKGDSNVGKTCLSFRFCGGKFLQRSEATIGVDFREKTIQIDDETIKLQIWDTGSSVRLTHFVEIESRRLVIQ